MKKHSSAYRNDIKNCFVESKLKAQGVDVLEKEFSSSSSHEHCQQFDYQHKWQEEVKHWQQNETKRWNGDMANYFHGTQNVAHRVSLKL